MLCSINALTAHLLKQLPLLLSFMENNGAELGNGPRKALNTCKKLLEQDQAHVEQRRIYSEVYSVGHFALSSTHCMGILAIEITYILHKRKAFFTQLQRTLVSTFCHKATEKSRKISCILLERNKPAVHASVICRLCLSIFIILAQGFGSRLLYLRLACVNHCTEGQHLFYKIIGWLLLRSGPSHCTTLLTGRTPSECLSVFLCLCRSSFRTHVHI